MEKRNRILIIDFMYLWNRIYAIKEHHTGPHIYRALKDTENVNYYAYKFAVLDGLNCADYRRRLLPDYKENRSNKSDSYSAMEKFLKNNAVNLRGIRFVRNNDFEADDLIAGYVTRYDKVDKYIYSGDTDLYQLLKYDNTYIGTTYSKGMVISPISKQEALSKYCKKYKLDIRESYYIPKCKTFKGDTSDNIPIACPGMKTATIDKLIDSYWKDDEPLSSTILMNMATYLKENGSRGEFENFFTNRKAIIRNYKLVQLLYNQPDVFEKIQTLQESGIWA